MAIGWIGQIATGNVQAQAQALLAAQAAAAAAGTPADIASIIAANPGAYGYFIPALLRAMGPAQAQNLIGIIGGAGGAAPVPTGITPGLNPTGGWGGPGGENPAVGGPVGPGFVPPWLMPTLPPGSYPPPGGGWGGPGGENPAYRPQGKVVPGGNPGMNPRNFPPYAPPNPMNAAVPSVPAAGQIPGVPAGWTPWGAQGMTFPQYYARMHEGVQGALGAVAPSADAAARQARLRAILGMGSAAAGVTARLRG